MTADAEGLNILRKANIGKQARSAADAETKPLRDPEHYQYDINLTAAGLVQDPNLSKFAGRVSDSGEGRWTIKAAIAEAVPAPVLTTALYQRFSSRGEADFANKLLSAMRTNLLDTWRNPAPDCGECATAESRNKRVINRARIE
jgi:6-phosphogluconate dehydrogenase